jgi:hypothetical protein
MKEKGAVEFESPTLPRALWAPAHEPAVTEEAAASGLLVLSGAEQPGDVLQVRQLHADLLDG